MGHKVIKLNSNVPRSQAEILAYFRKMPEGAVIVDSWIETEDSYHRNLVFKIWHGSWDDQIGMTKPEELEVFITMADIDRELKIMEDLKIIAAPRPAHATIDPYNWKECHCDLAYTGEKVHKKQCPMGGFSL